MLKYHRTVNEIIQLLQRQRLWFETFEHEPVTTSEEAAKVRSGYSIKQGTKAIIIGFKKRETERKFVMLVVPGDKRFDAGKVKKLLVTNDIRFATEEEVSKLTGGVQVGGIPPFGNLFGLTVFADPTVFENEKIIFNAGDRRFSVAMKAEDYRRIVNPTVTPIIAENQS